MMNSVEHAQPPPLLPLNIAQNPSLQETDFSLASRLLAVPLSNRNLFSKASARVLVSVCVVLEDLAGHQSQHGCAMGLKQGP